jgi:GAF domain-containing protein
MSLKPLRIPADMERMAVATEMRLFDLLEETSRNLVSALDAEACAISRVIGDVLLLVTEAVPPGRTLQLGQGYLVSEYPETALVLERRESRSVCLSDESVDEAEEAVLRTLGYQSLLMLPLVLGGETWGLVEVYRDAPVPFGGVEVRAAAGILARFAALRF